MNQRVVSSRFPYVPLNLRVRHRSPITVDLEALLDTGFDGDVALPPGWIADGEPPDGYLPCQLADGSQVLVLFYRGAAQLTGLVGYFPAIVVALGDEPLVGRGVSDRFTVVLDHGRELIIEP